MSCGSASGLSVNVDNGDIIDPDEFISIFESKYAKVAEKAGVQI